MAEFDTVIGRDGLPEKAEPRGSAVAEVNRDACVLALPPRPLAFSPQLKALLVRHELRTIAPVVDQAEQAAAMRRVQLSVLSLSADDQKRWFRLATPVAEALAVDAERRQPGAATLRIKQMLASSVSERKLDLVQG